LGCCFFAVCSSCLVFFFFFFVVKVCLDFLRLKCLLLADIHSTLTVVAIRAEHFDLGEVAIHPSSRTLYFR